MSDTYKCEKCGFVMDFEAYEIQNHICIKCKNKEETFESYLMKLEINGGYIQGIFDKLKQLHDKEIKEIKDIKNLNSWFYWRDNCLKYKNDYEQTNTRNKSAPTNLNR